MDRFVDLMASDIWSDADITNRTEAVIASEFSPNEVAILNRKATGAALGQYQLNPEEVAQIARYAEAGEIARQAGIQARADMQLLKEVLAVESAITRLKQPELDPETSDEAEVEADIAEREAAQLVIDSASAEAIALVELRSPKVVVQSNPSPDFPASN